MQSNLGHLDPGMQIIARRILDNLADLPQEAADLGARLLAKLSPPQWQLEWYLPRWLGDSYGLLPEMTESLSVANVTGLLYICLQDKLADDGLPPSTATAAICLSAALQHRWGDRYRPLLDGMPLFWRYFDEYLAQWIHALAYSNQMPDQDFSTLLCAEPGRLSHRAAPLKICCAAATCLAERANLLAPLTSALDHLHVAAVLIDHADDWREDLEAGRYNAFIHYASPTRQTLDQRAANRRQVYEMLFLGDAGRAYFDHALHHLDVAHHHAQTCACPPLVTYLDWYHTTLLTAQDTLTQSARQVVEAAQQLIFGE